MQHLKIIKLNYIILTLSILGVLKVKRQDTLILKNLKNISCVSIDELLTREGEIVIAKRIEEGIRELLSALAFYPGVARKLSNEYDLVAKEEKKLSDMLVGYLDPADHVPSAQEIAEQNANKENDDAEETDTGPDPVEAKKRFTALKRQCTKTEKTLAEKGYNSKEAQKEMTKLGEPT